MCFDCVKCPKKYINTTHISNTRTHSHTSKCGANEFSRSVQQMKTTIDDLIDINFNFDCVVSIWNAIDDNLFVYNFDMSDKPVAYLVSVVSFAVHLPTMRSNNIHRKKKIMEFIT